MGTRRGSDRPYLPPPTLKERLSLDWAANAALEEIKGQIAQGDLETALEVWGGLSPQQLADFTWSEPGSFEEDVLIAVIERLIDESEEAWQPTARRIWCFCGYPTDAPSSSLDSWLSTPHAAQFRFIYKHVLGNIISESYMAGADGARGQIYTSEKLRQMATDAYLIAVARQMSAIIKRGVGTQPIYRILTRKQIQALSDDFGRLGSNLETIAPQDYVGLLQKMLTSEPRPTPKSGLKGWRERRADFYMGLRTVLEGKSSFASTRRSPLSRREISQLDEIAGLPPA